MKLSKLFNYNRGAKTNKIDENACPDQYEVTITSEEPYKTTTSATDDGVPEIRTFTEQWEMQTDSMNKCALIPHKVRYNERDLLQIDLLLPDATTNRLMRTAEPGQMINLWLFLENGEFFINYPELIDPYYDNEHFLTMFRINLGNTGFHSNLKALSDKYSHEEICEIVRKKLCSLDIVEIDPCIVKGHGDKVECPEITVTSDTADILSKAFAAVTGKPN